MCEEWKGEGLREFDHPVHLECPANATPSIRMALRTKRAVNAGSSGAAVGPEHLFIGPPFLAKNTPAMFPGPGEDQAGGDSGKSSQRFQASPQFIHLQGVSHERIFCSEKRVCGICRFSSS